MKNVKVYVLKADSSEAVKRHVKGYKHPRISILYAINIFIYISNEIGSIQEMFCIENSRML